MNKTTVSIGSPCAPIVQPASILIDLSGAHENILTYIFSHLTLYSLRTVSLVCKKWRAIAAHQIPLCVLKILKGEPTPKQISNLGLVRFKLVKHRIVREWPTTLQLGEMEPVQADFDLSSARKIWDFDGASLLYMQTGGVCRFLDGSGFHSPSSTPSALFLHRSTVFIASLSTLHKCSFDGKILQAWELQEHSYITQLYANDQYLIAEVLVANQQALNIYNLLRPELQFTVPCKHISIDVKLCVYHGALFFYDTPLLCRVDLSSGSQQTFPTPSPLGALACIWHEVAFFHSDQKISLFHYPSTTLIQEFASEALIHSSALDENADALTLYCSNPLNFLTYTWTL